MAVQELPLSAATWTDVTTDASLTSGERYLFQAGPFPNDRHPPGMLIHEGANAPSSMAVAAVYVAPNDSVDVLASGENLYALSVSKPGKITIQDGF